MIQVRYGSGRRLLRPFHPGRQDEQAERRIILLRRTDSGGGAMEKVRIGLVGSQFISTIHAESLARVGQAEVVAAASATESHVREFAAKHRIPRWFTDYRKMLEMPELDAIVIG